MRSRKWILLCLVAALTAACATPRTYPKGAISTKDAARVEGAREHLLSGLTRVVIEEIDGRRKIEGWEPGRYYALMKPGEHTFKVKVEENVNGGMSLGGAVYQVYANDKAQKRNESTRRRLRLHVDSGYSYRIHQTSSPVRYLIDRFPTPTSPEKGPWDPPWDAKECLPSPESVSDDLLFCDLGESEDE